jgi:MFS family permease
MSSVHSSTLPGAEYGNGSELILKNESEKSSLHSTLRASIAKAEDATRFEKRLILFLDFRILPLLGLLFSFCLIDRINMGVALTAGMGPDLKLLVDNRFNIVSMIYFIPYSLLQLPGNILLRVFGPRHWLTFSILGWGAVQLGMGFVTSWGQLAATRVLLGVCEAPFLPALLFLVATWYKRHEVQTRMSIFYVISFTMGGIGPILAWALSLLNGKRNIAGWRWIFIIEGAITLFLGILAWFFIPGFPHENRFLTRKETEFVLQRVEQDRGDSVPDPLTAAKVIQHLKDWTLWAYGVMFFCTIMPTYALSYFISIILKGMGWSTTKALLLSAPPYGPPVITILATAWLSDRVKHRSGFIIANCLLCILGLCLTAFAKANAVRYFGTFLINIGNGGASTGILAYSSNNVVSYSKRTVQTAVTIMLSGTSGIIATVVFRTRDAPRYIPGISVVIASQVLLLAMVLITSFHFRRLNKLSREGKRSEPLEGQPGFFYTL